MSGMLSSMSNLGNNATSNIKNMVMNKKFLIILVIVAIFIGIAFYVYNAYVAPRINHDFVPNREFDEEETGIAEMYLFAVDWCPYSKKAKPVWNSVKKTYQDKKINNHVLKFKEIDGEKNSTELEAFENKYLNGKKIDGYPSIYMVKDSNVIEYEAKPDGNVLTEFINSVL